MVMVVMMVVMMVMVAPKVDTRRRPPIAVMMVVVMVIRKLDVPLRRALGECGVICFQQLNRVRNGFQKIPVACGRIRLRRLGRRGLSAIHCCESCRRSQKTGNFLVHRTS